MIRISNLPATKLNFPSTIKLLFLIPLFSINILPQSILINEFMASNSTVLADKDGEYSDWIEIYNPTSSDINLSGASDGAH